MPLPICYLDGEYLPLAEARVTPLDRAFLFGDAVYEVVPVYGERPFRLREHLDRLSRSLAGIRMPPPLTHVEWSEICGELIARNGGGDQYLYIQVTRGAEFGRNHAWPEGLEPTLFAFASPLEPPSSALLEQGVSAITAADTRWARRDIKSTALLANILLKKLSADAGCFETILLERGELTEGSSTTVHVVTQGAIHTPPNGQQILPGTTREVVERARAPFGARQPQRSCHGGAAARRGRSMAGVFHARPPARGQARRQARRRRHARPAVQADVCRFPRLHSRARRLAAAMSGTTLQSFPSEFPIKVMGRRGSDLRALTQAIIERHAGPVLESSVRVRTSADGNFLAVTYVVLASSREQLDAIYRELTACQSVLMAL